MEYAILIVIFALTAAGTAALFRWENKQAKTWEIVAEGELDHCECRSHHYTTRSGSMVHTTTHRVVSVTVAHFADGSSFSCWGHADPKWPKGTRVCVLKNGLGRFRLEKIGDDQESGAGTADA